MSNQSPSEENAASTLFTTRMLWFLLMEGLMIFIAVHAYANFDEIQSDIAVISWPFLLVTSTICLIASLIALLVRNTILKRNWKDDAVTPSGYFLAHLVAFAICEMAGFSIGAIHFAVDPHWLYYTGPMICLLTFFILWPNGKALQPRRVEIE